MKNARLKVMLTQKPDPDGLNIDDGVAFDAYGVDQVEFLIETNPGEGFKPLAKIASGGETSRLMLALKKMFWLTPTKYPPLYSMKSTAASAGGLA